MLQLFSLMPFQCLKTVTVLIIVFTVYNVNCRLTLAAGCYVLNDDDGACIHGGTKKITPRSDVKLFYAELSAF